MDTRTQDQNFKATRLGRVPRAVVSLAVVGAARRAIVGRERVQGMPEEGRFTKEEVDALIRRSWRNFDLLSHTLPWEPTLGARMNVILSALTISVYQALVGAGVEKEYAMSLMADAVWTVYQKWGRISRTISMLKTRNPSDRLRASVNLFLRFPFNPPSYVREERPNDSAVAFDIKRCPVADYFLSYSLPELCVTTWCNQDYPLAELWGGRLLRTGTIAGGAGRCQFVFTPKA